MPYLYNICKGLGGSENVFDIGDIENLLPVMKREKLYNIKDLKRITASDPMFVIGACAGPHPFVGMDSEVRIAILITVIHQIERRDKLLTYFVFNATHTKMATCVLLSP